MDETPESKQPFSALRRRSDPKPERKALSAGDHGDHESQKLETPGTCIVRGRIGLQPTGTRDSFWNRS